MPRFCGHVIWQIAERECFRFHFQVDLRVNVRGVQGDMPKPSPYGIDVHAGAKQMDRTRMSKTVRANAFCRERRQRLTRLIDSATDKAINAEPRPSFIPTPPTDQLPRATPSHPRLQ